MSETPRTLKDYARHDDDCAWHGMAPCTCGLDALLSAPDDAPLVVDPQRRCSQCGMQVTFFRTPPTDTCIRCHQPWGETAAPDAVRETPQEPQEIERLTRIAKSCGEQADTWAEQYREMKARAEAAEAENWRLRDEAILSSHRQDMELTRVSEENQRLRAQIEKMERSNVDTSNPDRVYWHVGAWGNGYVGNEYFVADANGTIICDRLSHTQAEHIIRAVNEIANWSDSEHTWLHRAERAEARVAELLETLKHIHTLVAREEL